MNESKLASSLRGEINKKISKLDIPKFLSEEIDQLLAQVNYYKLQNINNNIEAFLDYINNLNKQYCFEVADLVLNIKNENEKSGLNR